MDHATAVRARTGTPQRLRVWLKGSALKDSLLADRRESVVNRGIDHLKIGDVSIWEEPEIDRYRPGCWPRRRRCINQAVPPFVHAADKLLVVGSARIRPLDHSRLHALQLERRPMDCGRLANFRSGAGNTRWLVC